MNEGLASPKRRHILSSINPEEPIRRRTEHKSTTPSPECTTPNLTGASVEETLEQDALDKNDTTRPRRSRLKLKEHHHRRSRRGRSREGNDVRDATEDNAKVDRDRSSSPRTHRRHHRRRHRRRHSRSPTPVNPHEPPPLDADAAFRESLFDAMADDEGAAYWEGVYGQPVHVYSQDKQGSTGELERMNDDEYATYVRQKMWEKTHAGLLEERARREELRQKKKREDRRDKEIRDEMESSLRRGEERRQRRRWATRWEEYIKGWATWDGLPNTIPWPVEGDKLRDPSNEADIRAFFIRGLEQEDVGEELLAARLKEERVRWHPDKIQQRLGGKVDDQVMRDVTAIFQIVDRLWTDRRPKA